MLLNESYFFNNIDLDYDESLNNFDKTVTIPTSYNKSINVLLSI